MGRLQVRLVGRSGELSLLHSLAKDNGRPKRIVRGGQRDELQRIAQWSDTEAREGIRQELSPSPMGAVWDAVNADSSICSSKRCSPDTCFYRRAREAVDRADLVIVNHSLLFSLIGAGFGPGTRTKGFFSPMTSWSSTKLTRCPT